MISKRVALLIAPWCVVWVIAIGCSRQRPSVGESGEEASPHQWISAISPGAQSSPGSDPDGRSMDERYVALTESHSDAGSRRGALIHFYQQWGQDQGEAGIVHALAHNPTLARHVFAGWMQADPAAPREWVLSQAGSKRRQAGLAAGLLHAMPASEHETRGEWASHFATHPSGARLVSEVAIGWGTANPQAALGWLADLPEGRARSSAIETVFRRWTEDDPQLASTHLTRMASGGAKDLAISSLAKAIHKNDPEAARLWAETIGDEQLRERTASLLNKLAAASSATTRPEL